MSYVSLYRKYRPNKFNEVIGQQSVIVPLKNSVKKNLLSHAYLFYGPRGTGKTTVARIFAKAINCLNSDNGEVCNNCEICQDFQKNLSIDIIEIDAASNNGVDEIRELREKALLMPAKCQYKVYIIDEVHMLTNSAFNALLKILEEPPNHVIFILATTEFYKIPATIISRCQQYNFHNLSIQNLQDNLIAILKKENILYEESAINQIALLGNGGCRDAITFLEQAILFTENNITLAKVNELFLIVSKEKQLKLFNAILVNQMETVIKDVKEIISFGCDCEILLINFLTLIKEIYEYKITKNLGFISFLNEKEIVFYNNILLEAELINCLDLLTEMYLNFRFNKSPEMYFEIIILKLAENFKKLPKDISLFENLDFVQENKPQSLDQLTINNNQGSVKITENNVHLEENKIEKVEDLKYIQSDEIKQNIKEDKEIKTINQSENYSLAEYYSSIKEKYNIYQIKDINYSTFMVINILISAVKSDREYYELEFKNLINNIFINDEKYKELLIAFYNVKYVAGLNQALIVVTPTKAEANWISYIMLNNSFRNYLYSKFNHEFIILPVSEVEFISIRNDYLQMRQVNKLPEKKGIDIEWFYKILLEKQFDNYEEHQKLIEKGKNIFNNIKVVD